jgi:Fe2+ or Zn2+ uptake regulation protein
MTDARARIVRAILGMEGPFTARDLIGRLRLESSAPISNPTVYRLLPLLVELGVMRAVARSGGDAQYEPAVIDSPGHRLVCTQCGRVKAFESVVLDRLLKQITRNGGFDPSPAGQRVLCRCDACQKRMRQGS